jgi:type VI secretion system secreted protein VgrG
MFAHALGMKLVAARGDIVTCSPPGPHPDQVVRPHQPDRGRAHRHSRRRTVRIVAPGAQTDWADGAITHQSSGQQVQKGAGFVPPGPGQRGTPTGIACRPRTCAPTNTWCCAHLQTTDAEPALQGALRGRPRHEGRTDAQGRTALLIGDMIGAVDMAS